MKFTKEDALKELKSKIPTNGEKLNLSERSIKEQIETLLPLMVTEETELDDFVTKVLPIFRTADANVRNDVSVGIKQFKDKNPKPDDNNEPKTPTQDGNSEELAKLLKRITELEKKNEETEKSKKISERRSDIISKMQEKGCKNKEWIEDFLNEVNLDVDDFNVDERVEKYLKVFNKSKAARANNSNVDSPEPSTDEHKELDKTIEGAAKFLKEQQL